MKRASRKRLLVPLALEVALLVGGCGDDDAPMPIDAAVIDTPVDTPVDTPIDTPIDVPPMDR